MSQVLVLAAALGLDLVFRELPNPLHPVAWMGRCIAALLRLKPRGDGARFFFGAAVVLSGAFLFGSAPALAGSVLRPAPFLVRALAGAFLLRQTFTLRTLLRAGKAVEEALRRGDLDDARRLLSFHLVSRDTAELTEGEVAGAAIESLAENLTDGFLAPLLFFRFFGLPGAWVYRFVNTCDSMIAYRDREHEYLGKFAAHVDTALNYLPARIAGLAIVAAAVLAGGDGKNALRTMLGQHGRAAGPNAGWTMAAAAGALGVSLRKRGSYELSGGAAEPTVDDLARAGRLTGVAGVLLAAGLVFFSLGGSRVFFA